MIHTGLPYTLGQLLLHVQQLTAITSRACFATLCGCACVSFGGYGYVKLTMCIFVAAVESD
jgi:hypothetical protein